METAIATIHQHLGSNTYRMIYKHSTTCLTSSKALKQIQTIQEQFPSLSIITLEVHEERGLSDWIEEYFEITHESPQCILFKGKKIKKVMNHFSITSRQLSHFLQKGWNTTV